MYGQKDTFSYDFIQEFSVELAGEAVGDLDSGMCRRAYGIQEALRNISQADNRIRIETARVRNRLNLTLAALESGLSISESNSVVPGALELDRAIQKRESARSYLVTLLTPTELSRVGDAAYYPGKVKPEEASPASPAPEGYLGWLKS